MNFEFFIAKRYLRGRHKFSFITIISLLSTLGITIGVAALIVVLSVFNGFGSIVTKTLLNFDPHLKVSFINEKSDYSEIKKALQERKDVKFFAPYVDGRIALMNRNNFEIVTLKGIGNFEKKREQMKANIISGSADDLSLGGKLMLGLPLALKLGLRVGDTVQVISAKELQKSAVTLNIPNVENFILGGIYEVNNKEYAFSYGFTDLTSAQKVLELPGKINGVEIFLNDFSKAENYRSKLSGILGGNYKVYSWYDLHKNLFDVMLLERWAAYILLSLIIIVAVFNILTSLTMSVLEKRKDIALLQTIGAKRKSILKIFMFEGLLAGGVGTLAGTVLGIAVCYGQIYFKFYALDPMKYIIDALPVELRFADIFIIALMSMLLSFSASLYPARHSLKLNLIESIKWE